MVSQLFIRGIRRDGITVHVCTCGWGVGGGRVGEQEGEWEGEREGEWEGEWEGEREKNGTQTVGFTVVHAPCDSSW